TAFWDSNQTPDRIAQLTGQSIHIPLINRDFELNSFALHILLMALSPSEVWSRDELERVAIRANHHLSVLLNCQFHGATPGMFDAAVVDQFLEACPETGPRAALSSDSGWQHDNRWIRCTNIFEPTQGEEVFNGLDWLMLYNFRQLVFAGQ